MRQTTKVLLVIFLLFLVSCSVKRDDTTIDKKPTEIDYLIDQKLKKIAQKKSENTVLLLLPISGVNEKLGIGILNACILSSKEFKNINVDFCVIDTADANLEKGQLYKKFRNTNLIAIVGPVFFKEARQYGALFPSVPIFTFSNNLKANNDHIFACGLSPHEEINEIFSYAKSKELNSFLILLPEGTYGDEILNCVKSAIKHSKFDSEEIEFIRYRSMSQENAMKCVKNSGKKAVFAVDPILDIKDLEETKVFTLSSHAIDESGNPEAWDGAIFAFPDSDELLSFKEKYRLTFGSTPNFLDILGYDLCNAIFNTIENKDKNGKLNMLDEEYNGCLGKFKIIKNKGLKRNLDLFQR